MIKTKGESDKLYQAEICVNNYTYHLYKIHLVNIILFQRENQDKLIWNKIKNDWFALEKEDFVSWLVQTKSKVHIHTYGYITRTFNRKGERLIHRQRLTSVDRRCSTIFFLLLLVFTVFLPSNQRFIQCRYTCTNVCTCRKRGEKEKKFLNVSQEKCDQNKRKECVCYSPSCSPLSNIGWINDVNTEHCSGAYILSLSFFRYCYCYYWIDSKDERWKLYTHKEAEKN